MSKIVKAINFFKTYFFNHYAIKFGLYLPKPTQVYWNITDNCNFKCVMCDRWKKKSSKDSEVSEEQIKTVIDDLADWGVYKFGITGGEPFIRKHATLAAAEYASARGLWTHIGTNGFLLDIDTVKDLKKIGIGHISISIDGDEQSHDEIRQQRGSYQKILTILEWAKEFGVQIKINTVLTSKNVDTIIKTVELAVAEKFPIFIQPYNPYNAKLMTDQTQNGISELNENWIGITQIAALEKTIEKIMVQKSKTPEFILNDIEHLKNIISYFSNPVSLQSKCVTGYKNLQINPAGDIIPCWNFNQPVGNIKIGRIREIWKSDKFNNVRKLMDNCKILCISGCRFYPSPLKLIKLHNLKFFLNPRKS